MANPQTHRDALLEFLDKTADSSSQDEQHPEPWRTFVNVHTTPKANYDTTLARTSQSRENTRVAFVLPDSEGLVHPEPCSSPITTTSSNRKRKAEGPPEDDTPPPPKRRRQFPYTDAAGATQNLSVIWGNCIEDEDIEWDIDWIAAPADLTQQLRNLLPPIPWNEPVGMCSRSQSRYWEVVHQHAVACYYMHKLSTATRKLHFQPRHMALKLFVELQTLFRAADDAFAAAMEANPDVTVAQLMEDERFADYLPGSCFGAESAAFVSKMVSADQIALKATYLLNALALLAHQCHKVHFQCVELLQPLEDLQRTARDAVEKGEKAMFDVEVVDAMLEALCEIVHGAMSFKMMIESNREELFTRCSWFGGAKWKKPLEAESSTSSAEEEGPGSTEEGVDDVEDGNVGEAREDEED
jgi:hypothetical protein